MSHWADVASEMGVAPRPDGSTEDGLGDVHAVLSEPDLMRSAWPLQSCLELGALPGAVPSARLHVRHVMREWGLEALAETVELIVSELTTNSVQASEGLVGSRYNGRWAPGVPPVRLWLSSDKQRVLIQVWDGNHRMPVRREVEDVEAEGGRGLLLVETLTTDWGAYVVDNGTGKVVWGVVSVEHIDRNHEKMLKFL